MLLIWKTIWDMVILLVYALVQLTRMIKVRTNSELRYYIDNSDSVNHVEPWPVQVARRICLLCDL